MNGFNSLPYQAHVHGPEMESCLKVRYGGASAGVPTMEMRPKSIQKEQYDDDDATETDDDFDPAGIADAMKRMAAHLGSLTPEQLDEVRALMDDDADAAPVAKISAEQVETSDGGASVRAANKTKRMKITRKSFNMFGTEAMRAYLADLARRMRLTPDYVASRAASASGDAFGVSTTSENISPAQGREVAKLAMELNCTWNEAKAKYSRGRRAKAPAPTLADAFARDRANAVANGPTVATYQKPRGDIGETDSARVTKHALLHGQSYAKSRLELLGK